VTALVVDVVACGAVLGAGVDLVDEFFPAAVEFVNGAPVAGPAL
jgi:hypothetical protein